MSQEEYTIREIEEKDDQQVESVIRSCLREFGADHEGTAWADPDLGRFSSLYSRDGWKYWVAEDRNGNVVAGAGIGELEGADGICELQKMYALPEARGKGVAQKLMEKALAFAGENYKNCYIETLRNMTAAQKFYERYGFKRVDEPVVKTDHFACDVRYLKEFI